MMTNRKSEVRSQKPEVHRRVSSAFELLASGLSRQTSLASRLATRPADLARDLRLGRLLGATDVGPGLAMGASGQRATTAVLLPQRLEIRSVAIRLEHAIV